MRTLSQIAAMFGVFLIVSGAWVGAADQLSAALRDSRTAPARAAGDRIVGRGGPAVPRSPTRPPP